MYNNLCLSNSKSNNFKIKNQLYPPTPHKLKSLSLCQEAHTAGASFFHWCLSKAAQRAAFQGLQPALFCSTSTVSRYVFGCLLFLLPSGVHTSATAQSSVWSLLAWQWDWSTSHLLLLTTDVFFFCHLLCCHVSSLIWVSLISGHCSHSLPSEILCLEHKISTAL